MIQNKSLILDIFPKLNIFPTVSTIDAIEQLRKNKRTVVVHFLYFASAKMHGFFDSINPNAYF